MVQARAKEDEKLLKPKIVWKNGRQILGKHNNNFFCSWGNNSKKIILFLSEKKNFFWNNLLIVLVRMLNQKLNSSSQNQTETGEPRLTDNSTGCYTTGKVENDFVCESWISNLQKFISSKRTLTENETTVFIIFLSLFVKQFFAVELKPSLQLIKNSRWILIPCLLILTQKYWSYLPTWYLIFSWKISHQTF